MSYSIKKTHVILTGEQMRALVATLEAVRDADDLDYARMVANTTLAGLTEQGLLSQHNYPYPPPRADETDVEHWNRRALGLEQAAGESIKAA